MGHFSPIVKQIRKGIKPDSICMVVGSCADGYEQNETGDLIYSFYTNYQSMPILLGSISCKRW